MIMFVMSDTHNVKLDVFRRVIAEATNRKADIIIHCGDITLKHIKPELFNGLPVVCALTKQQVEGDDKDQFLIPPAGWTFTRPGQRIYKLNEFLKIYVGHATSFEFLAGSEAKLRQKLHEIRRDNDEVRWFLSGHTHHQILQQSHLITFVNPGAVQDSFDGYEFAVIDTDNGEIVFGRIPKTDPVKPTFSVGIISDSLNISDMDPNFWRNLSDELKKRGVRHVIHCGNIAISDIGRSEFADFQVFYNLRPDQKNERSFANWRQIPIENPVVEIEGYRFYVQLDLGADLMEKSEVDMYRLCLGLRRKYPEISFVLCGFTNDAFYEEGQEVRIINPGDILKDRNYAVVCLPRTEITLAQVAV